MKKKIFVALGLSVIIVASLTAGAYAGANLEEIQAYLNKGVNVKLNGQMWQPKDSTGANTYPITYNNTTWLPVKSIGDALGVKVGWDAASNSVLIGDVKTDSTSDSSTSIENFSFDNVDVKKGDYGWTVTIDVTSKKDFKGAFLTASFYDGNGKRVGKATGTVLDIKNGEMKTVDFSTMDDLTGYKTIKYQVDMTL
jgi:hypothetical protein